MIPNHIFSTKRRHSRWPPRFRETWRQLEHYDKELNPKMKYSFSSLHRWVLGYDMPINWVCCCCCCCYFVIVSNWLQFPIGFEVYRISICSISTHVLRQVLFTSFRHIFLLVTWSYTVDSPKLWFVGYCFYWPAWKSKSRTQGKQIGQWVSFTYGNYVFDQHIWPYNWIIPYILYIWIIWYLQIDSTGKVNEINLIWL